MRLEVKVGAATDASFNQVFKNISDAAAAANKKIVADEKSTAAMHAMLLKAKLAGDKANDAALISESAKVHDHLRQLETMRLKASLDATKRNSADKKKAEVDAAKDAAREVSRIDKAVSNGGGGGGGGASRPRGPNMPRRIGYWAARNFSPVTPMLSYAGRAIGNIARGAGVNFDVGQMVGNKIQNEKLSTDISNAGYQAGASGAAGQRQDPAAIYKETKEAADASALSQQAAAEGLQKFVGKTGDLATGREILKDIGKLARANGADFDVMVDASAQVALGLGDVDNKGKKVGAVMRAIAGQGKLGAVEIRDMATQMGKLAGLAQGIRGGAEENMSSLGAMTQMAVMHGGAGTASRGATAAAAFIENFSKKPRSDAYKAITGHDIRDKNGMLARPEEAIMEMLKATKGNDSQMAKVFADKSVRRATRGWESVYRDTKGTHEDKLKAVDAEFNRFKSASEGNGEVDESFKKSMETTEAKVQIFQNKLQDVADRIASNVLPAMEKLAPTALKVVEAFGSVVSWLASNPFAIIPAALTAAIAKGGTEQAIRLGVEAMFKNFSGNTRQQGFGGGQGAGANLSAAFVIASAAFTIYSVGTMAIDSVLEQKTNDQKKQIAADLDAGNAASVLKKQIKDGKVTPEALENAKKAAIAEEDQIARMRRGPGVGEKILRGATRMAGMGDVVDKDDKATNEHAKQMLAEAEALRKLIATGTLKVIVTNPTPAGPPPPPPAGTNDGSPTE